MAETTTHANLAPVTEESLLADRMSFWASFTSAGTTAAVIVAVLVVGLYLFFG
jgi:hypothetical protein